MVSLLGANGAGKTTLLNAISGFLKPVSGTIAMEGVPIGGKPPHSVFRHGIETPPLSRRLVRSWLERLRSGLTDEVRGKAVLHIADTVGIALAAAADPLGHDILRAARAGEAQGVCGVLGDGVTLPSALAAFTNAALAHAFHFDDIHDAGHFT